MSRTLNLKFVGKTIIITNKYIYSTEDVLKKNDFNFFLKKVKSIIFTPLKRIFYDVCDRSHVKNILIFIASQKKVYNFFGKTLT
jgi:hypothetical protein